MERIKVKLAKKEFVISTKHGEYYATILVEKELPVVTGNGRAGRLLVKVEKIKNKTRLQKIMSFLKGEKDVSGTLHYFIYQVMRIVCMIDDPYEAFEMVNENAPLLSKEDFIDIFFMFRNKNKTEYCIKDLEIQEKYEKALKLKQFHNQMMKKYFSEYTKEQEEIELEGMIVQY